MLYKKCNFEFRVLQVVHVGHGFDINVVTFLQGK
jgi:hypothetical protein